MTTKEQNYNIVCAIAWGMIDEPNDEAVAAAVAYAKSKGIDLQIRMRVLSSEPHYWHACGPLCDGNAWATPQEACKKLLEYQPNAPM